MDNKSDQISLSLLKMSREIITLLQDHASEEVILEKMNQRDKLVIELENTTDDITNTDVILELLRLRNNEKTLLEPFMDEFHDVRQALINLKQAESYQTSDL
jgi:hypothetical protein